MMSKNQRPRVTVEDLLHLKRAERPSPEFWVKFEAELRQKQLAALLEKRPWWHSLAPVFERRLLVPVGATAALALSLVTVHFYTQSPESIAGDVDVMAVAAKSVRPSGAAMDKQDPMVVETLPMTVVTAPDAIPAQIEGRRSFVAAVASTVAGGVTELLPWSAPRQGESPSARSIAANLARIEQNEPELLNAVLGDRFGPAVSSRPDSAPLSVEMATVSTGTSRRSSRLLASYNDRQHQPESSLSDIVRERAARRLADPELLDQIRRLDVKGNSVSLKL